MFLFVSDPPPRGNGRFLAVILQPRPGTLVRNLVTGIATTGFSWRSARCLLLGFGPRWDSVLLKCPPALVPQRPWSGVWSGGHRVEGQLRAQLSEAHRGTGIAATVFILVFPWQPQCLEGREDVAGESSDNPCTLKQL